MNSQKMSVLPNFSSQKIGRAPREKNLLALKTQKGSFSRNGQIILVQYMVLEAINT
jgi:hypothetical protein